MLETHFLTKHASQAEKTSKKGRGRIFTVSIEQGAGSQQDRGTKAGIQGILQIKELCGPCWGSQGAN